MCAKSSSSETNPLQHTALYSLHQSLNAKIVAFTGYALAVQYSDGIKAEHLHTRSHAGLFDVSHMGQIFIRGEAAEKSLEALVSGDITALQDYQQRYTLLTNAEGGIIDDLMVTKMPDGLFLVVNAACKDADYQHMKKVLGPDYRVEMLNDRALLALQGPEASAILAKHNSDIAELGFMRAGKFEIDGINCIINRCGYTGEDGFEISVDNDEAEKLAKLLLEHDEVKPVGLGARDSLRLEAGLCLYGHDIDASTTPIEANLHWAIALKYRNESAEACFPGAGRILQQLKEGTDKLLVGLKAEGKMPIREGHTLLDHANQAVGQVTSGGFGPSADGPVALGYVSSQYSPVGTELHVEIRNRSHTMRVADLPFVAHQYYKP
jgi:aminomethyltransferase